MTTNKATQALSGLRRLITAMVLTLLGAVFATAPAAAAPIERANVQTYPAGIYLRGEFNDWGYTDADEFFRLDPASNLYYLQNVNLVKGSQFKIADNQWATYDYGGYGDYVVNDVPMEIVFGGANWLAGEDFVNADICLDLDNYTMTIGYGIVDALTGGGDVANVPMPVFTPGACAFYDFVDVTISPVSGETVYYTIDGSNPTVESGTLYTAPLHIEKTTTVKAIAVDAEGYTSRVTAALYRCNHHGIGEDYNPSSPPDPTSTDNIYKVIVTVNPSGAGNFYSNQYDYKYKPGDYVELRTYARNSDFQFVNWTIDGEEVSTIDYYTFTMPDHDVAIVANYVYQPGNPEDPEMPELRHPVMVTAQPSGAGYFNFSSTSLKDGEQIDIYAYTYSNFRFKGWKVNGEMIEQTTTPLIVTMEGKPISVTGVYEYYPASPVNPGANYWNPATGQLIMDDFTPGWLFESIYNLTGWDNLGNISSIVVKGKMTDNDLGAFSANNYENLASLDLSRVEGINSIPSYGFEYCNATSIYLPACISSMGWSVFGLCENLTSINVYATVPPVLTSDSFADFPNKGNCVIRVPSESIPLYQQAQYWKDFNILPLSEELHAIEVSLPDDCSDGRYKNNRIELVNINTGARQKYVVTDRLTYTFIGLQKDEQFNIYLVSPNSLEIGRIENILMADQDLSVKFGELKTLKNVEAKVVTDEGADVTTQATVEWYKVNPDGSRTYLRKAVSIGETPVGEKLVCQVTLPQVLGVKYADPGEVALTVDADTSTVEIALQPLRRVSIEGTVVNEDNKPLGNATVSVQGLMNGKHSVTVTARTGADGKWTAGIGESAEYHLTYSAPECVNLLDTVAAPAELNLLTLDPVTLRSIASGRISYGFTYTPAVKAGEEPVKQDFYEDYKNVSVKVYNNTQERAHNALSVQYPEVVILDENVQPGDELTLTAVSSKKLFGDITRTVTLDENLRGAVTFDITGKGGIEATYATTENPDVTAMLYNSNGNLVSTADYTDSKALFSNLQDGAYSVVSIGKSDLLGGAQRLESLGELGLAAGTDFCLNEVNVAEGVITVIANEEIPPFDENRFNYTSDYTSFSANKPTLTPGNYLTLKSQVDFKNAYKNKVGDVKMIYDLPVNCELVENSVMVGKNIVPYVHEGNTVTVPLGSIGYSEQVRFVVVPTSGGTFAAMASVEFSYDDKTLVQPVGTALCAVKDLDINVSDVVATPEISVSGTAPANSDLKLYDGTMLIGSTRVNAVGKWQIDAVLPVEDGVSYSQHYLHGTVTMKDGTMLDTETKEVVYNDNAVIPLRVEMLTPYPVVFDFVNKSESAHSYSFVPSNNLYTFLIYLKYNDLNQVKHVWLNVFLSNGDIQRLQAFYDAAKDCWSTNSRYDSSDCPTSVSVDIDYIDYDFTDETTYEPAVDDMVDDLKWELIEADDISYIWKVTDEFGNEVVDIEENETEDDAETVEEDLINDGYEKQDPLPSTGEDDDEDLEELDVYKKDNEIVFVYPDHGTRRIHIIRIITNGKTRITEIGKFRKLLDKWQWRSVRNNCATGERKETIITDYHYLETTVYDIVTERVMYTHFVGKIKDLFELPDYVKRMLVGKKIIAYLHREQISQRITTERVQQEIVTEAQGCIDKPEPPADRLEPSVEPIIDPAGYVYEAVPSNRLAGVQASCYYKETVEDMYGDLTENIVLWNAEEYAQQNPLFTDENGMYQWDVPQGLWQVKFEKDGYVSTQSEWLPVPPPQLEVNIAMTQNSQPEVIDAHAYETGVQVEFDKYMNPASITGSTMWLTVGGTRVEGEIVTVDEEKADPAAEADDADAQGYARIFRFIPAESLSMSQGEIRLNISREVKSYAGIPMRANFSQEFDIEKEITEISAPTPVQVLYGGERTITVDVIPFDASMGKTLKIANNAPTLLTVENEEVVIDENGQAQVHVTGELPGQAVLTFTVDGAYHTGEASINIVPELYEIEMPVASRANGTEVYRGTKVTLSTETPNSTIYYTLDGTEPDDADGSRMKYALPIEITSATNIKAIVITDGNEKSETAEFSYTLRRNNVDYTMAEGWTWISHNLDENVLPAQIGALPTVNSIIGQTAEVVRDPELGLVGNLKALVPGEAYKVEATAESENLRLSDFARDPSKPISVSKGWNWLGYTPDQTMSVQEAFETTELAENDYIVGQRGFAQYNGTEWIGDLNTLVPGCGYMFNSGSDKTVVYNNNIVSNAASRYPQSVVSDAPWAVDIHKYPQVMCVAAKLVDNASNEVDPEMYYIGAFCDTECRGVGKVVNGMVLMTIYGRTNEQIEFAGITVADEKPFAMTDRFSFAETLIGNVSEPYEMTVNPEVSGAAAFNADGNWTITVERPNLIISGGDLAQIKNVSLVNMDGLKVLSVDSVNQEGISIASLASGIYAVVIVDNNGYSYYKILVK